jgi:hypothetical protein
METQINGVRVEYRDKFPARQGWDLMQTIRRVDRERRKAEEAGEPDFLGAILAALTFEEITRFVQGAVASWDFPGDLSKPDCLEGLDPLKELLEVVTDSVLLFYAANGGAKLQGEAASGSTSPSEG